MAAWSVTPRSFRSSTTTEPAGRREAGHRIDRDDLDVFGLAQHARHRGPVQWMIFDHGDPDPRSAGQLGLLWIFLPAAIAAPVSILYQQE
jgi:hypothetical protein